MATFNNFGSKKDNTKRIERKKERDKTRPQRDRERESRKSNVSIKLPKDLENLIRNSQYATEAQDPDVTAKTLADDIRRNQNSVQSRNMLKNLGISSGGYQSTKGVEIESSSDKIFKRSYQEALDEALKDGLIDDNEWKALEGAGYKEAKKEAKPEYDQALADLRQAYELNTGKLSADFDAEIESLAKDKDLYLNRFNQLQDRIITQAAEDTGRTQQDLAKVLETYGIMGKRERQNIEQGYNASGRYFSSERQQVEAQSLQDQQRQEQEAQLVAGRNLTDIDTQKKQGIENVGFDRSKFLSENQNQSGSLKRNFDYSTGMQKLNYSQNKRNAKKDYYSGIQALLQNRLLGAQTREKNLQDTIEYQQPGTFDPLEETTQAGNRAMDKLSGYY